MFENAFKHKRKTCEYYNLLQQKLTRKDAKNRIFCPNELKILS